MLPRDIGREKPVCCDYPCVGLWGTYAPVIDDTGANCAVIAEIRLERIGMIGVMLNSILIGADSELDFDGIQMPEMLVAMRRVLWVFYRGVSCHLRY